MLHSQGITEYFWQCNYHRSMRNINTILRKESRNIITVQNLTKSNSKKWMTEVNRAIKAMKRLHYEPSSIRPMKPQTLINKESEILRSSRSRNAMCKTTEKSCIALKIN
ncbi:hypothetical protein OS493_035407 [Desmophyllum pertusum]|uniref:Uncharacterized protein n=1 Tax=Desmophyllum pertusum TaxID=174260 RepID=A0A9W9ZXA3_9CNID|nr:hypothetical protein OS493_035407 [Desmophyllum pertusum]